MPQTVLNYFPGFRNRLGFASFLKLGSSQILMGAKVGLDQFTVPLTLKSTNPGSAFTIAAATAYIGNLGAAASGNYVLGLMKNGIQIAAFTIPYVSNASGFVDVDLRTQPGFNGIPCRVGDILRLDIISGPASATAGASDIKLTLTVKTQSIDC